MEKLIYTPTQLTGKTPPQTKRKNNNNLIVNVHCFSDAQYKMGNVNMLGLLGGLASDGFESFIRGY